ncbi:protein disulfide-isomerase A6 [Capronia coronata CBS 617.96]|uniref:protein disulfide-isomerase n=1 Tax=Capronia coronata CBS 617.96 TaxID=1182541 RepID=W9YNP8_9EURO|nr:protein disulfide-isomerase A6 [Capronia coronata CBS 617.96]EXJ94188.1 protein disulfide-isomerase A6 [Capronia coronata CBS 617.96]
MVQLRSLLSLAALALPLVAAASDVVNLIPSNFDKIVFESNKPALVEFFAPWCGHCKNLAPTFEQLATAFAASGDKVTIANVDADNHKELGKRFGVQGFPTLKWFDGKPGSQPEDYNGGRDLESLTKFIVEKTGVKVKGPKKAPSHVEMLTDTTFKQEVGGDKDVLVAFTAPWCGHCKTLAPTWEKLADDFAAEPNVLIAKIDAEAENSKATAQAQGITGYPTIMFFPKGSTEPEPYSGPRSEEALVDFVNSKASTYRLPGGGLNTQAGTVEAIDSVLAKYITAGGIKDVEKATAEIKKKAKDVKDKSVDYYLRALSKLSGNPEYAKKEQTRLAGLLKKGGLAPEKIDDLQRRSNVLSKFLVKDAPKSEL